MRGLGVERGEHPSGNPAFVSALVSFESSGTNRRKQRFLADNFECLFLDAGKYQTYNRQSIYIGGALWKPAKIYENPIRHTHV